MDNKRIVGQCPVCGSDVVKTLNGYACSKSLDANPSCNFFIFSNVGNRYLNEHEISTFLKDKKILLDGFATKEGKIFTSILNFNPDGTVNMNSQIAQCPQCGGTLYVGARSVSCSNFKNPENRCSFTIWRHVAGHDFTLQELQEIICLGAMSNPVDAFDKMGICKTVKYGLNENKEFTKL